MVLLFKRKFSGKVKNELIDLPKVLLNSLSVYVWNRCIGAAWPWNMLCGDFLVKQFPFGGTLLRPAAPSSRVQRSWSVAGLRKCSLIGSRHCISVMAMASWEKNVSGMCALKREKLSFTLVRWLRGKCKSSHVHCWLIVLPPAGINWSTGACIVNSECKRGYNKEYFCPSCWMLDRGDLSQAREGSPGRSSLCVWKKMSTWRKQRMLGSQAWKETAKPRTQKISRPRWELKTSRERWQIWG